MLDLIVLANAAQDAGEHGAAAFGLGPAWWVALSMITLIGIMIYFGAPAIVAGMLDRKIASIREVLDEASTLRAEAEALRAEFEEKVVGAAKHAEQLRAGAEQEAKLIVEKAKVDAAELVARREKIAQEKIAAAERAAIDDLRAKAAAASAAIAEDLIRETHSASEDKKLVDQAISNI